MPLEVTIESTDRQLTTTSAVKAVLGTTSTADDAFLDALITRASEWASAYVGYPLWPAKYLETVPGYGTRRLMLSRTPLLSVTGVFYGTDSGSYEEVYTSEVGLDREAGFVERRAGWAWTASMGGDLTPRPTPGEESPEWRVEYVAGYSYAGLSTASVVWSTEKGTTSTGRTLPHDVEAAVIERVIQDYNADADVLEKQVGDLRIRYGSFGTPNDPIVKDRAEMLLARYRRLV